MNDFMGIQRPSQFHLIKKILRQNMATHKNPCILRFVSAEDNARVVFKINWAIFVRR